MDIVPTRLKNAVLRIIARSKHRAYYLPQREQQPNTSSHVSTALHQICFTNPVLQERAPGILVVPAGLSGTRALGPEIAEGRIWMSLEGCPAATGSWQCREQVRPAV